MTAYTIMRNKYRQNQCEIMPQHYLDANRLINKMSKAIHFLMAKILDSSFCATTVNDYRDELCESNTNISTTQTHFNKLILLRVTNRSRTAKPRTTSFPKTKPRQDEIQTRRNTNPDRMRLLSKEQNAKPR